MRDYSQPYKFTELVSAEQPKFSFDSEASGCKLF